MNISQIKEYISKRENISLPTLSMVRQLANDETKTPQPWLSHWDNDNRIRISIHEDTFMLVKADININDLATKFVVKDATAETASYKIYTIIQPKNVEATW